MKKSKSEKWKDLSRKKDLMLYAIREAHQAVKEGNYPFGAILASEDGTIIMAAHNTQNSDNDPTAHAEMNLIRGFSQKNSTKNFDGLFLVCNAESCSMCFSAAIKAGITHFIFGAPSERHMEPYLTVADVVKFCRGKLDITYRVLADECRKQIAIARNQQGKLSQ